MTVSLHRSVTALLVVVVASMLVFALSVSAAQAKPSTRQFVKKDLYIFVYDTSGKCMAHGFNKMRVGKDLISMKDQNGVFYVKERIELANAKGKGWQNYKETNPATKKIEPKRAYIEKEDNYIFGSGFYRK